jgi:hypothetical protein
MNELVSDDKLVQIILSTSLVSINSCPIYVIANTTLVLLDYLWKLHITIQLTLWHLVRVRTIPTERSPLVGEVSVNF